MNSLARHTTVRRAVAIALLALWAVAGSGCAAHVVPAYKRERLADRIMSFQADAKKNARLTKSFDAREGSTGGTGGAGGGCACN